MIYAVIDTNVFVSALFTRHPNSATTKVVEYVAKGIITPLFNEDILAEYEDVLSREKFHVSGEERESLLTYIRLNGKPSERVLYDDLLIDETDRVFYEVSLSEEDSFLVTGNLKHFPSAPHVVTPAQMVQIVEVK